MGAVKSLYMDDIVEGEAATYDLLRDAKYLSVAPKYVISHNRDWIVEARELLNDALAKVEREEMAA